METIKVSSFEQLQLALYRSTGDSLYRGMENAEWELLPKLWRMIGEGTDPALAAASEKGLLRMFKKRAIQFLTREPSTNWDWLALAQHHGLPTRLLDWTGNPLVAAFFAVENDHYEGDSAIWCYESRHPYDLDSVNPFSVSTVDQIVPPYITPRLSAQSGCFTIHPFRKPVSESDIKMKIIIADNDWGSRAEIKHALHVFGIHRASLFPDLDGLSSHLSWWLQEGSLGDWACEGRDERMVD